MYDDGPGSEKKLFVPSSLSMVLSREGGGASVTIRPAPSHVLGLAAACEMADEEMSARVRDIVNAVAEAWMCQIQTKGVTSPFMAHWALRNGPSASPTPSRGGLAPHPYRTHSGGWMEMGWVWIASGSIVGTKAGLEVVGLKLS
jgi:hypothetical protein